MLACVPYANAGKAPGLMFTHIDWEIACDNTRTCRAAGYHGGSGDGDDAAGSEPMPVSVLLTRKAGPREAVHGELKINRPGADPADEDWLRTLSLTMRIDAKPVGTMVIGENKWTFSLSAAQTALLISALTKQSRIEWSDGKLTWKLSDKGAAAVLLKMDEYQGRIGTPGALVRSGSNDEGRVLPPLAAPVVLAAKVPADDSIRLSRNSLKSLRVALNASMKDCAGTASEQPADTIHVRRLSATHLLASATCWTAAYNEGSAYWLVNAKPPYSPKLITDFASDYSMGKISASLKGRGMGDCESFAEWTWDGKRFVPTSEGTTGQCKSVAPGGAWSLPVLTTTVRPVPASR